LQRLVKNTCFSSSGIYMNNYETWIKLLQWNFQLWIDLYGNQISQISFYKKMKFSPYYFNPIILFWSYDSFWCPKPNVLTLNLDFINTYFLIKNGIRIKCSFILIILLFSFHVIGVGKFQKHVIEKMCRFAYIFPNRLKGVL